MSTLIQTFVGNIGIGTNDPGNYKLRVDGEVRANSLEVNGVSNVHVPIGLIAMWYGSVASIPDGWALCDGTTGITRTDGGGTIDAPNLVNRFVRGADGDSPSPAIPGQSGGANTVSLAEGNLPAHAHPFTGSAANANHAHTTNSADAPHGHNTNTNNANHNHGTNTANAPHGHNTQYGNANHAHNTAGANAPHAHGMRRTTGPRGVYCSNNFIPSSNQTLFYTNHANAPHSHYVNGANAPHYHGVNGANAPHNHGINSNNAPHSHGVRGNNAPHNHGINADNAPHTHGGNIGQTGSGTAVTLTNPYYILAYIMKI